MAWVREIGEPPYLHFMHHIKSEGGEVHCHVAMTTCQNLEIKLWRANGAAKVSAVWEDLFYVRSTSCCHAPNLGGTLVVACSPKGRQDLGSTFFSANCAMIVTECAALLRSIPIVLCM